MTNQPLPARLIVPEARKQLAPSLNAHRFGQRLLLVADENTWEAAGASVFHELQHHFQLSTHVFKAGVHAELTHAKTLTGLAENVDAILAIGSGTINDLCKYTAHHRAMPYAVVATAASMNGYTSANASLMDQGVKASYSATPPALVVVDPLIIAASPTRLTRAGVGDLFCRSTVEMDMLLSHHWLGTAYPEPLFLPLREAESALLARADDLLNQRPAASEILMLALLDSGDAMTAHGSSAVASQGEHMIAHLLEQWYPEKLAPYFHGEIIAVTTLTMLKLQEKLLAECPSIVAPSLPREYFYDYFGDHADEYYDAHQSKQPSQVRIEKINSAMRHTVPAVNAAALPYQTLAQFYEALGMPSTPQDIGLSDAEYMHAVQHAHLTRNRFTFLDWQAMRA